ncbi:MAG: hypothetical protein CMJ83_02395 [Planctomycetes bacterium]|nr:hypothetical protein [Planctomycetota bacterium]
MRESPFAAIWKKKEAHFGQFYDWERPLYFNSQLEPRLTFGRPEWFPQVESEVIQAHTKAALFDQSTLGKIRIEGPDAVPRPSVPASSIQRIEIGFEVGPLGIDEGGLIFVEPDPFWYWSSAQAMDPNDRGYTTISARKGGVELRPSSLGAAFSVSGRALAPGERLDIVYGAGPNGARVDRYAERGSEILIGVDADGNGTRAWLPESVQMDITAREGVAIFSHGPAELAPGEPLELTIAIVDAVGNRARWPASSTDASGIASGRFRLRTLSGSTTALVSASEVVTVRAAQDASFRIAVGEAGREGTIRLGIEGEGPLEAFDAFVHPIVVRRSATRLVWADLHGHTQMSDGSGTPEEYFAYARDIARLDVIALTDHDHWGPRPLATRPDRLDRIHAAASRFHAPERFVTIPGYEWTSWLHGHRHVLSFDEEATLFSAFDARTDRPDELWNALRGRPALTFAHHTAGEPIATNWIFAPDPELEPLAEIASVHGMSEAADAPVPVHGALSGFFVRDALMRGDRLGFVGSGDSHDGHPGLAQIAAGQSGLAGLFTEALDRPELLAAMKRRHTFATNGIRPWLEVTIDEAMMGGTLPTAKQPERQEGRQERPDHLLRIRYEATAPIDRIDPIRSGRVAAVDGEDRLSLDLERRIPPLGPGEFHYVRIVEQDGGVAWSSPIFAARQAHSPVARETDPPR